MFDIPKDQLLRLNDGDLRELVVRLCQAELGHKRAPVSSVRWGGPQAASDGGLDVEILVKDQDFSGDFVPKAWTGIQVKKSSMSAGEIAKEMSPKGKLRAIILDLARHNGCYIIVSLADDPAGTNLGDREKAMQAQVESIKDQGDLRVEFYGRGRLSDWLRQYPSVQLWVREKLGLSLSGWKSFGRWSPTPPEVEDDLICKEGIAISLPGRADKLGIIQGIEEIRELMRSPEKTVRIVGLSGVGKTRIVQALFEDTIGDEPLDRNLAIYADLGEEPEPSARDVVGRLTAEGCPAIIVLDNCPSVAHRTVAGLIASAPDLRLITVEFDIREDRPESTNVVRIDAEGPEVAQSLVQRRYPHLGPTSARRIAELSGGNARLALVLADSVREQDNLSTFFDPDFFKRLFYQREAHDTDLLKAAQVLALVYSFSISSDEEGVDELAKLATLLEQGRDGRTLYGVAQTLVERQLAQKRGRWRAVLPDAVGNWLAERALRNIPEQDILGTFEGLPNVRLLKSFGKRLGYLHDHEVAQRIVRYWLSPSGRLHDLPQLNNDDVQLLWNVAPVASEDVLRSIEAQEATFFSRQNPHVSTIVSLLTLIAHDAYLFERCIRLLAKFALTEKDWDNIRERLFGLFSLYLSGTEAGPDMRGDIVRRFLTSDAVSEQCLGLGMLKAALQSDHWSSTGTFEFGARPRSFGYQPKTYSEQDQWFMRFIALAQEISIGDDVHLSDRVRSLIANELESLWSYPGLRAMLADLVRVLNEQRPWLEGWRAVLSIKRRNCRKAIVDGAGLLDEMDETLMPQRLSDKIRIYVLNVGSQQFPTYEEFDVDDGKNWRKAREGAAAKAYQLGTVVAGDSQVMDELSLELFTSEHGYLFEFGRGVAAAWDDLRALWSRLVEYLEFAGNQAEHCGALAGTLEVIHRRDETLAQEILDEAVQNPTLRKIIVSLQVSIPLDHAGVNRLHRSLDFEDTPVWQFENLPWPSTLGAFGDTGIRDLAKRILDRLGGAKVVLQGLAMWLHALKDKGLTLDSDLKRIGLRACADLLRQDAGTRRSDVISHYLSEVLASCLDEDEFPEMTACVINACIEEFRKSFGSVYGIEDAATVLAEKATFRFLDGVFFDPILEEHHRQGVFRELRNERNLLSGVSGQILLEWCEQGDFQERLAMLSGAIFPFRKEDGGDRVVLSEQAYAVIEAAREPSEILENLASSVWHPMSKSWSDADVIAMRGQAFEVLLKHECPDVVAAAAAQIDEINERVEGMRNYEQAWAREREQRFE